MYQLSQTLDQISAAADSLRALSDYLNRHPEALLRGKGE
jgi:paraquat-inducible protein B